MVFETNETWLRIKNLIIKGVQDGKLIIPYTIAHLIESSTMIFEKAIDQDIFLFNLSDGKMLDEELKTTCKLLISNIRGQAIDSTTFFSKISSPILSSMEIFDKFTAIKSDHHLMVSEPLISLNKLREASAGGIRPDNKTKRTILSYRIGNYQNELNRRFDEFHKNSSFTGKEVKYSFTSIPFWADMVFVELITKHRMSRSEAYVGKSLVESMDLKALAPTLYIRVCLETAMGFKYKKENSNDYVDIMRLATGIPVADILITDKSKADDIRLMGLDKEYDTVIFSGSIMDLGNFTSILTSLIDPV
jgi:hypothetical protein